MAIQRTSVFLALMVLLIYKLILACHISPLRDSVQTKRNIEKMYKFHTDSAMSE